jgi:predicted DCC family thiol-disulfide oxidoreductase YuxK
MPDPPNPPRVKSPPPRPLLIFDGDCHFCRRWIARWRQMTGERVDYASSQTVGAQYPEIAPDEFKRSVQLIEPTGEVFSGAHAVLRALATAPGRGAAHWCYERVPGFRAAAEAAYNIVARHRRGFSSATNLLWGRHLDPSSYRIAHWLLARGLGVVYLIAFISLWTQIDGLVGSRGIVPIGEFLKAVHEQIGSEGYRVLPTLAWIGSSDRALHLMCGVGVVAAGALTLGLLPLVSAVLCYVLYLSLFHAGNVFLGFQWDLLLLETGFLGILLVGSSLWSRPSRAAAPPRVVQFLLLFLLFKLMFCSGVVKLTSGDPTWHGLTALTYHYETQPLPPWTAWYAHHAPVWFHKASCVYMFTVELVLPFLIWGPRRLKQLACLGLVSLQVTIAVTGNYCFFNLLAILLCLPLLDDFAWPAFVQKAALGRRADDPQTSDTGQRRTAGALRTYVTLPFAFVILVLVPHDS